MDNIYKHLSHMESLFLAAADSTNDPVRRVILNGMYNDWINFKHEKWKDSFYMLEKGESQVLTG